MIEITNTKQAFKLAEAQKQNFGELLSGKMREQNISADKLADKVSLNSKHPYEIEPRSIRHYVAGQRGVKRPPKENDERPMALAEALGISQYELLPDHALVNADRDGLPDDEDYWFETIETISRILRTLPAQQAELLCKSHKELQAIPAEALDITDMYSLLDEESQTQFLTYMGVLQNESCTTSLAQYSAALNMFEKNVLDESSKATDSWDLFQLLKTTFPDKENTEDAETFYKYLFLLLNQDNLKVLKNFLLLDSDIKREMILRIADQMLATLNQSDT